MYPKQVKKFMDFLGITHPIIQGGMTWVSGSKLATAVSQCGGLGVLGAGSLKPPELLDHIKYCQEHLQTEGTETLPFAVNLPLFSSYTKDQVAICLERRVPIVITSAGSPSVYTKTLQEHGCKVGHVVANKTFALKAIQAGVDFIVVEGFEAGGHNGKDELTTLVLVQQVLPLCLQHGVFLVCAGGIATGFAIYGLLAMGCSGVQLGSYFIPTVESSGHENFKRFTLQNPPTKLYFGNAPVRLAYNAFVADALQITDTIEQTAFMKGKTKQGVFDGDLENGELQLGQMGGGAYHDSMAVESVKIKFERLLQEYLQQQVCI
jgi:enoyl-[acyl-carrier protein] reductase II